MTAAAATQLAIAQICASWNSQASRTVLDTGFGDAHHFLALLQTWRTHASAPAMLHYVGVLSQAQAAQLPSLLNAAGAAALATLCYALEPGFHRLLLEDGQISLTLCVGETFSLLDRQQMQADSLLLACPAQPWDKWQLKALARCCKRGAQLLFAGPLLPEHALLTDAGFQPSATSTGTETRAGNDRLHAVYDPRWQLRSDRCSAAHSGSGVRGDAAAGRCAVIGAGIAGASVARALALRDFQVDVYDAQAYPAGGASGLPMGLVVPHHSADDSPRSRLSRSGTRLMLQHADHLLQAGQDWQSGGVLELNIAGPGLAEAEAEGLSCPATATTTATATHDPTAAGWARPMAYGDAQGLWHPHAAWIKPSLLVQRWLDHPHICFHGQAGVRTLERLQGQPDQWLLRDAQGQELGRAERVVFANAYGCVDLVQSLARRMALEPTNGFSWVPDVLGKLQVLQRMYGTLSYGPCPAPAADARLDAEPATPAKPDSALLSLPAFPVNGHGSFASGIPTDRGPHWYAGATFQSDASLHALLSQEHAANFSKLQTLLPAAAQTLAPQFASQQVQAWQGSRCISHDRLPLVGPLEESDQPTLWLCAGMGARGLSFSALCAELLMAGMCGEPLPMESNLARSLGTRRPRRTRSKAMPRPRV
jgi:tRNA 5-methylaminomethyl-2-thiouridine biosynthesis bifunctional protein